MTSTQNSTTYAPSRCSGFFGTEVPCKGTPPCGRSAIPSHPGRTYGRASLRKGKIHRA
jgi:hypothetical protein